MSVFTLATRDPEDGPSSGSMSPKGHSDVSDFDASVWLDRVDGLPVYRLLDGTQENRCPGDHKFFRTLVSFCENGRFRPDVLQLLSMSPPVSPWLWRLRRLGVPMVFTQTMVARMSERWWERSLQRLYWPLPYRFIDCVVVSSGVMKRELRKIGVTGRVEVIPNGVDLGHFRPLSDGEDRSELRRTLGLPESVPILLYVGSISPRKGIDLLAEAWERMAPHHPECHLVLVGPRHDEIRPDEEVGDFFQRIEAALERSGARDRVTFTGPVDDVRSYLQASDVFVFPSRREGMPNVIPEAYACGLPTVMTPFVGLPDEFGRPGVHHLLVDHDPEELATGIQTLLRNPDRARSLGQEARSLVEEELSLQESLDRYARLYHELAGS